MPAHQSVSRRVMAGCLAVGLSALAALAVPGRARAEDAVPSPVLPAAAKDAVKAVAKNKAKPKVKPTVQAKSIDQTKSTDKTKSTGQLKPTDPSKTVDKPKAADKTKTKIAKGAKPAAEKAANAAPLPLPAPDPSDMPLAQATAKPASAKPAQPSVQASQAVVQIPLPPARPREIAADAPETGTKVAALSKTTVPVDSEALQSGPIPLLPLVPQMPQPSQEATLPAGSIAKTDVDALIVRNAGLYHVPENLLRRVVARESGYNPHLRNGPYIGLMQMRLETARGMGYRGGADGLLDANVNLTYGVAYLANAYKVAEGNQDHAVRLYSSGYYYEAKRKGLLPKLIKTAPSK